MAAVSFSTGPAPDTSDPEVILLEKLVQAINELKAALAANT